MDDRAPQGSTPDPRAVGLRIGTGQRSAAGQRPENDDRVGLFVPDDPATLALKGVAAIVCDGVSAADAGGEAADTCVRGFLADYYATPDSWTVDTAAETVLTALNRSLYARGRSFRDPRRGYLCTLSAVVIKSRTAHLFHIGDSRVYLARGGRLEQVTQDHKLQINEASSYLSRAMGLDLRVSVDHRQLALEVGDVLIMTTDGLHDFVDGEGLVAAAASPDLSAAAARLVQEALAQGSDDNASCQLLRVEGLPAANHLDLHNALSALPFPPPDLARGMVVDGYRIVRRLHESPRSQLYAVEDTASARVLVMKTPSVRYEGDPGYLERFVMEPWIGSRVKSPHVIASVVPERRQTFLYHLLEFVDGVTLEEWTRSYSTREVGEVTRLAAQIGSGLLALHRREIIHRDLKPDNVMVDGDGHVTIVDLGGCFVAGVDESGIGIAADDFAGTSSYGAPELRAGAVPTPAADQYSLAVLTYELLTGSLPYPARDRPPRSDEYVPAHQRNPLVPVWLNAALRRAVRPEPGLRYGELTEFLHDLSHPNPLYLEEQAGPLFERHPVLVWRTLTVLLVALELFTLYYFLERR